ncbi:hypothetical protein BJD99_20100 [Rhodococcus sp. 1163]|uniref:DUF937 domain-containing protein n=1 Tax=Rhodococcus sp. 1163 TaxID=1905289 RepID=UPI000A041A52|nr:DUF937 domain-containing protein [Rhodococcus sp. 1163]ORI19151.1 hypothetical protein BJD99_20100 [Rhodococcus sp. 1163]
MASLDELLAQIPIGQIASKLGVDEETAKSAVTRALPTLVGGLEANAQDPAGAASLENALQQHRSSGLLDGGVDIDQVDETDGAKIVSNVFGDKKNDVASALGGISGGADSSLVSKVLPILAPIVLAYLAKKYTGGQSSVGSGGGGLGDLLGSVLGGATSGSGSGGGLGGLLGGILGGGSGGGIGDLLGGLLGGGKK